MNRVALMAILAAAALRCEAQTLSDADIKKLLVDRIGADADRVGIVVGIIDPSGRRIVSYGSATEREPSRPLDGDTCSGSPPSRRYSLHSCLRTWCRRR